MARTEEAEVFYTAVYLAVQEIPFGKVTTYGHVATLVGMPHRPRQVGVCLKHLPTDPTPRFNNGNVPWHRVISAKGIISPRTTPNGAAGQAAALRTEGVEVTHNHLGELSVDMVVYGWFPGVLPSTTGILGNNYIAQEEPAEQVV